ncbi:MAG: ParB/RepB/Spo0J family partition protein [Planctomycetaceae bacterium]|nr:ParB/RepB/Spo0J family partition protein [Planctomycetaceae bacterium]
MRESVGADAPAFPGIPAPAGAEAERLKGVSSLKRAFLIPVDRIVSDPEQPRREFDPEGLRELAESLKTRGQLQPVRVRWDEPSGNWVLISGERRWRAAALAGLPSLQAVEAKGTLTPDEILEDQLVENCLREDLKPIEQARAFKALMDVRGWSHRQLAEQLHIAPSAVSQALALLRLPDAVQESVEVGNLAPSAAYELSKVNDPENQARLAAQVVAEGLSRAETAEVVRRASGRTITGKGRGAGKGRKAKPHVFRTKAGTRVTVESRKALDNESILAELAEVMDQIQAMRPSGDQAAA